MEGGAISDTVEKMSFFEHVFQFDEAHKNEFTNMIQYAVLAIVPIIIVWRQWSTSSPKKTRPKVL